MKKSTKKSNQKLEIKFQFKTSVDAQIDSPRIRGCEQFDIRCTQKNLFKILLNQPEISLYLAFFRLIWIQTDVCLVPIQSENGKYYLISG